MQSMMAHAQFCMSGDHTLSATVQAINELAKVIFSYSLGSVCVLLKGCFYRMAIFFCGKFANLLM